MAAHSGEGGPPVVEAWLEHVVAATRAAGPAPLQQQHLHSKQQRQRQQRRSGHVGVTVDYLSGGLAEHVALAARHQADRGAQIAVSCERVQLWWRQRSGAAGPANGGGGGEQATEEGAKVPGPGAEEELAAATRAEAVRVEAGVAAAVTDRLHELLLAFATIGGTPSGQIDPALLGRGLTLLGDAPLLPTELGDLLAEAAEATPPAEGGEDAGVAGLVDYFALACRMVSVRARAAFGLILTADVATAVCPARLTVAADAACSCRCSSRRQPRAGQPQRS